MLELKDLLIGYGIGYRGRRNNGVALLPPITTMIGDGKLTCLIGRNGIGKSTLLRTIAGLQPMLGGSVSINGVDISTLSRQSMARLVSIVLTDRLDLRNMSVEELVAMGRSPYTGFFGSLRDADRVIVGEAIEMVGIGSLATKNIDELSDGERQKVMIARALAQQTPVILLDEPTAFLDYDSKRAVFGLLCRLAKDENKTVLMSSHDLELVREFGVETLELKKKSP